MQESRNSGIANIIRLILIAEILIIVGWAAHSVVTVIHQSAMQAQKIVGLMGEISSQIGTHVAQALLHTQVVIDPVIIIQQLRYLARLETIQYNFDKVIPPETRQGAIGFLFGDRLFLEIGRRLDVIFETSTPTSHP